MKQLFSLFKSNQFLEKFLDPKVVQFLKDNPKNQELGGEQKEVTIVAIGFLAEKANIESYLLAFYETVKWLLKKKYDS